MAEHKIAVLTITDAPMIAARKFTLANSEDNLEEFIALLYFNFTKIVKIWFAGDERHENFAFAAGRRFSMPDFHGAQGADTKCDRQ